MICTYYVTIVMQLVCVCADLCKDKLLAVDVVGVGADNTHVVSLRSTDSDKTISELLEQACPTVSVAEEGTAAEAGNYAV